MSESHQPGLVSVVIACYNAERYIGQAVDSVLAQTYPHVEVLVCNDGSLDSSAQVLAGYGQKIRAFTRPNAGVSNARNAMIELARGTYLTFLDADDAWLPEKLQRQVDALEQATDAVAAYCPYFEFKEELDDLSRPIPKPAVDRPDLEHLYFRQNLAASCCMIHRDRVQTPRFDSRSGHGEDTILAGDLALAGPIVAVDEPLVAKRVHDGQVTRSAWHRVHNAATRVRWLHEHASVIGEQRAAEMEKRTWRELVEFLENLYWKREIAELPALCKKVRELAPQAMADSFLATRRIRPRWMYRLRDLLSR